MTNERAKKRVPKTLFKGTVTWASADGTQPMHLHGGIYAQYVVRCNFLRNARVISLSLWSLKFVQADLLSQSTLKGVHFGMRRAAHTKLHKFSSVQPSIVTTCGAFMFNIKDMMT